MGFYIETPRPKQKAQQLRDLYGAKHVSRAEAEASVADKTKGVVVVVSNLEFDAAAFAYDEREFARFSRIEDLRPKSYLILERRLAERLANYKEM
jgi:uncharacterized protein YcaQ